MAARGLGKGLDSLIPNALGETKTKKEAETADQYIEKFAHTHGRKYDVTVATSDGLEQIIIRGQGCRLLSARELKRDYEEAKAQIRTEYLENQKNEKTYMMDGISLEKEQPEKEN